jgi:hypothetical protein
MRQRPYVIAAVFLLLVLGGALILRDSGTARLPTKPSKHSESKLGLRLISAGKFTFGRLVFPHKEPAAVGERCRRALSAEALARRPAA